MTDHGRGKEIVWDEQSGIFHGSSSTNPQESDGGQGDISILTDGDLYVDEDLRVPVKAIFEEKEVYEQIFQNKLKKRIIRNVSKRDKNNHYGYQELQPLYFSIGPTYHGDLDLQPIESAKVMHLTRLMRRVESPRKFLIKCLQGLKNMMGEITSCYDTYRQCLSYFSIGQILKMILLDAFFIIHLIIESKEIHGNPQEWIEINETHDEVRYMKESSVINDLLLFENEIPFDIISFIWKLLEEHGAIDIQDPTESKQEEYSPKLVKGMLRLFNLINQAPHGKQHYRNLLDFYHQALPVAKTSDKGDYKLLRYKTARATLLQDVGVEFHLKDNTKNINDFMDITYELGDASKLNLPLISNSFARYGILRSLLAFEYDRWRKNREQNNKTSTIEFKVFPYIHFMILLIQNVEDATILMKAGIFDSTFSSMDDIVNFFPDLWSPYKSEKDFKFPTFTLCYSFNKFYLDKRNERNILITSRTNPNHQNLRVNPQFDGDSDAPSLTGPDLQIIDEVFREFPRYFQISFNSIKRRMIYYVSERDKNYRTRESTLPLYFSIGLIHHGDPDLQRIEDTKIKLLITLLHRMAPKDQPKFLNECLKGLKSLEFTWKDLTYDRLRQKFNPFNEEKILKILLLDASFIINLIKHVEKKGKLHNWILIDQSEDEMTYMKKSSSVSDLLLFENEIPFDIINLIWKLVEKYESNDGRGEQEPKQEEGYSQSLIKGILHLFNLNKAPHQHEQYHVSIDEVRKGLAIHYRNLLDFYHHFLPIAETSDDRSVSFYHRFLPSSIIDFHAALLNSFHHLLRIPVTQTSSDRFQRETIPSATELEKVGCVKFQLKEVDTYNINSFMAINFEDGNLYFPLTNLSIARKEILRSLLLFEYEESQQNNSTNHPFDYKVFPYIYFMSCLLRSGKDAKILMNAGIFDNEIGSMEDIAKFFSDLWRPYIYVKDFEFPIFKYTKAINKRHNSKRKTFRAVIKRIFFANPLIIFSVLSALAVLVMTALQTHNSFKQIN